MSGSPDRGASPFEAIADALDEPAGRARFMRGLTLGALVGAAVVGSILRARRPPRRPRQVARISAPEPAHLAAGPDTDGKTRSG